MFQRTDPAHAGSYLCDLYLISGSTCQYSAAYIQRSGECGPCLCIGPLKRYLDIDKDDQMSGPVVSRYDPLKHWKPSPIGAVARHWKAWQHAMRRCWERTPPWRVVDTNRKHMSCSHLIREVMSQPHNTKKWTSSSRPPPDIAFEFTPECIQSWCLARRPPLTKEPS